jgi:hypothetical protein
MGGRGLFDFLKRRAKGSKTPSDVEIVSLRGTVLTFRSTARLSLQGELEVRLPDGAAARVRPGEARSLGSGLFEYAADVGEAPDDFIESIVELLKGGEEGPPSRENEQRSHARESCSFQVISRDLEGFKALSADVSRVGIRIVTREKLKKGRHLDLRLEFDDEAFPPLQCGAEVMWSRVHASGFSAGLRFLDMTAEQHALIERYNVHVKNYRKRFGF